MKLNEKKGLIFAILTAVISGISIFYNKTVIVSGIDPLIFNILKNGGVALLLTVLLISTKKSGLLKSASPKLWLKLGLVALVGGSLPFLLFFDALRSVPAVNAAIIQKSLFIWVALLAIPLLGERLTFVQILGYILVAGSNLFLGGFTGLAGSRAEFMILTATLLWSVENIIAKIALKDTQSIVVAWARMFLGTIILLSFAVFQQKTSLLLRIQPGQYLAILGSILLLTGYVVSLFRAIKLAPVTLVTAVLILSTPITNVLTAVFITHTFPLLQTVNLVGTVAGLVLVARIVTYLRHPVQTAVS